MRQQIMKLNNSQNKAKSMLLLATFTVAALTNVDALAQGGGSFSDVTANISSNALTTAMCNIMRITTGNAGKAFAAFAIVSVGIGFFTGKVSWGLMVGVAAGIAAMFGAPQIVSAISGTSAVDCK
jgi:type IV secretory pathway VirB2 component (pilin)